MKIRDGFVSNSSSSSFIIPVSDNFPNIRSLATYMINKQIEEDEYYDDNENKQYIEQKKKYIKRLEDIDENHPTSFPSCNYDTYIKKIGDFFFVATCNNTDWDLYDDCVLSLNENTLNELKRLKKVYRKGSSSRRQIKNILKSTRNEFYNIGKDYYDLNEEVIGIETYDHCPKCNKYLWKSDKYGIFCLDCSPYHKRLEKLNQINKLSE